MYNDELVVDAVTHAYNHDPDNYRQEATKHYEEGVFEMANQFAAPGYEIAREQFFKDHTAEELERLLFLETDVDYAVHHTHRQEDFFIDGMVTLEKGLELRKRNPQRISVYGNVNPLSDSALDELETQVNEHDVDAIKLYPVRFRDGKSLEVSLNDPNVGWPILEKAEELGIDHIAVHKAIPLGPTPLHHYGVEDVDEAAASFTNIDFEVVHAGFAFLEETAFLLANHDNVHANFEATMNLLIARPRHFAEILGEFLYWAGPDRLMFGTGATFTHPQPLIEAFWEFEFPDDLKEEYGYPYLTDTMKKQFIGLNCLELLGIDPATVREHVEQDQRHRKRSEEKPEPWDCFEGGESR